MKLDKQKARLALNAAISAALLFIVYKLVRDPRALQVALAQMPASSMVLAILATLTCLVIGSLRWAALLRAYGGQLPWPRLFKHYFEGYALNMLVPGGVVGDVARSVATQDAFAHASITTAISVTFIERVLGLLGLIVLAALSMLMSPLAATVLSPSAAWAVAALAVLGTIVLLSAIAILPKHVQRFPQFARQFIERLPTLHHTPSLVAGALLSLGTQFMSGVTSFCFVHALVPDFSLVSALATFTIANAAAFLPSLGGLGAREGATVALLGLYGVQAEQAVAISIMVWLSQILCALLILGCTRLLATLFQKK